MEVWSYGDASKSAILGNDFIPVGDKRQSRIGSTSAGVPEGRLSIVAVFRVCPHTIS